MPDSPHMSRREFITIVTATVGTAMGAAVVIPAVSFVIAPALQVQISDTWIPMGPVENFPIGVPTLASFVRTQVNGWERTSTSYGVYIIRNEGDAIKSLSNVCTHLSCRVNWDETSKEFICPCHDAAFDIQGEIVDGPQPRPLDVYENKIEEGIVYIHFVEA